MYQFSFCSTNITHKTAAVPGSTRN